MLLGFFCWVQQKGGGKQTFFKKFKYSKWVTVMKRSFVILFCVLLMSCSGTGTKNFSAINSMMMSDKGKVFVGRERWLQNSAQLYEIRLNGKYLGKLGNGEVLVSDSIKGTNYLESPYGFERNTVSFEGKNNSNNFFIVKYECILCIAGKVKFLELTESSFRNVMQ